MQGGKLFFKTPDTSVRLPWIERLGMIAGSLPITNLLGKLTLRRKVYAVFFIILILINHYYKLTFEVPVRFIVGFWSCDSTFM